MCNQESSSARHLQTLHRSKVVASLITLMDSERVIDNMQCILRTMSMTYSDASCEDEWTKMSCMTNSVQLPRK